MTHPVPDPGDKNHCVALTSIFHTLSFFRIIAHALQNAEAAKTH